MAKSLENKPNTGAPDSTWPYGDLKDETQSQSGTPVNKEVYEDIHQFFMKLMAEAGISFNEMFDNADNGFQLWEALYAFANTFESEGTLDLQPTNTIQPQYRNSFARVTDSTSVVTLQAIEIDNVAERDHIILVFDDAIDLIEPGDLGGIGEIRTGVGDLTVREGVPYVFRNVDGRWYIESAAIDLFNRKANREQEDWTDVTTFGSDWGSATTGGAYDVGYRKDEFGNVELRGLINSGGSSSGTVAFELPGGYIPGATIYQPAVEDNTPTAAVQVDSNGDVSIWYNGSGNVYLDSVRFEAHQ